MNKFDKIFIAGHRGMVGSAILRKLKLEGFKNILTIPSKELDCRNQSDVCDYFKYENPSYVIIAAAKVGGIFANNSYPAEFIYDNVMIQSNIIHSSYVTNVKKLLFLGSSCIYPKGAPQPIKEEYLLSGYLESTNQPYAIAKICGIEMCKSYRFQYGCDFISAMPTNLYGTNDNYHPENSHVLPSLIRKFIVAKKYNYDLVDVWGSGTPRREFLHVDDLASACYFLLNSYSENQIINIGYGEDIAIKELAELIASIVQFNGNISFDSSKPDGTQRKLLDSSKISKLGWKPSINLIDGIKKTVKEVYNHF